MPWQLALSLSISFGIITSLVQRIYAQKSSVPATFPSAVSYALGVLPVGYVAGFFLFPHAIYWSWWLVVLLVIEGVAMAISVWTGFLAAGRMAIAPRQTLGCTTNIVVILLGWTLLSEKLTVFQSVGAIILLIAALLAIWAPYYHTRVEDKRFQITSVLLTLTAAVTLGVGFVTEKAILNHMQIGGNFLLAWTAQTLAMIVLAIKDINRTTIRRFTAYELRWSILMGLAGGMTGIFYVYTIVHSDNISLISALTSVSLPLTVLAAHLYLKERDNRKLLWASLALSFCGLIVSALK